MSKMLRPLGRMTPQAELGTMLVLSFLPDNVPVSSQEMWTVLELR